MPRQKPRNQDWLRNCLIDSMGIARAANSVPSSNKMIEPEAGTVPQSTSKTRTETRSLLQSEDFARSLKLHVKCHAVEVGIRANRP